MINMCFPVIIKPLNDAVSSWHANNFPSTKCNCSVVEGTVPCFSLKLCVFMLPGGAGVCPAERRSIQQGEPHLPPLEDQRQEVRTDLSEPC